LDNVLDHFTGCRVAPVAVGSPGPLAAGIQKPLENYNWRDMAFKIIRDFVENPVLIATCDRSCGMNVSVAVARGHENRPEVQAKFLTDAAQQGWQLGLEHVCPSHVKAERENKPRIVEASRIVLVKN
jgi:hypothetical protein